MGHALIVALVDTAETFVLVAPIYWVIEIIFGRRRNLQRRGFVTDLFYWVFTPVITHWLSEHGVIVSTILLGLAMGWGPDGYAHHGFGPIIHQPLVVQIIEAVILTDLLGYWSHRIFHSGRFWHFHAIHHSAEHVDWMTTNRTHPVNDVIHRLIQTIPLFLMGFPPLILASFSLVDLFFAFLVHAEVNWTFGPLRYIIVSPVFHRWHHSKQPEAIDKNFATLFPIWDLMFGTFYLPRQLVPCNFGVNEAVPEHLVGQLAYPFGAVFVRGEVKPVEENRGENAPLAV